MILHRFGIVASIGRYYTTCKPKYGNRKFRFYRITVCKLSNFNILEWDKGVKQELNARKTGDLLWAMVKRISKCRPSRYVYDFSVPETENFVAGNGVCCHNTYGPRLRPEGLYGRAVSRFIAQAVEGQDITVYGDGSQTRSFCYVTDTIRAILCALTNDAARGEVLNIGNPGEISILELAKKIKALLRSESRITFQPMPQDDPRRRCPDISKAKKILSWQPEITLDEGLRRTASWFSRRGRL
jgi:UDP-glucuronate decarboxylase